MKKCTDLLVENNREYTSNIHLCSLKYARNPISVRGVITVPLVGDTRLRKECVPPPFFLVDTYVLPTEIDCTYI